jgi:hypothetical protein
MPFWKANSRPELPDDSAYLYILRESACPGPYQLYLQVDGVDQAQLEKGHYATIRLAPGEHRLHLRAWELAWRSIGTAEMEIEVEPNEIRELTVRVEQKFLQKDVIHFFPHAWRNKVRDGARPPDIPGTIDWSRYRLEIVETGLMEEPAGPTSHVEDNTDSDLPIWRQTKVANEWSQDIVLGGEVGYTKGVSARLGVSWLSVEAKLEKNIKRQYAIQQGQRQLVAHEVQIQIPARSRVQVTVNWKRIWRQGLIRIHDATNGTMAEIPFRVLHSMDFDRHSISS